MSIVSQIKARQSEEGQARAAEDQAAVEESQKPDAGAVAQEQRAAHRAQMDQFGDVELQDVAAGPEEQAMVTKMEKEMLQMLHSPEKTQQALTAVMASQDPVQGIGTVAADIVTVLQQGTPNATDDVLGAIGERAVEELTELLEIANPQIDLSEDDMAEAVSIGVQTYMGNHRDQVDDAELQGFIADV